MKTPVDSALLLQDLLTEKELRNLAKRLRIAELILSGKTHEEILRKMRAKSAGDEDFREELFMGFRDKKKRNKGLS